MAIDYSVQTCKELSEKFNALGLHRPQCINCYDAGSEISYDVTAVETSNKAKVSVVVE